MMLVKYTLDEFEQMCKEEMRLQPLQNTVSGIYERFESWLSNIHALRRMGYERTIEIDFGKWGWCFSTGDET